MNICICTLIAHWQTYQVWNYSVNVSYPARLIGAPLVFLPTTKPENSAMKCVAFSRFTSIDWFSLSYSMTERNTFEATITSNPCVRVDIITWRPKLHMKINLRLVLLRLNTPQTYSTSRCFHNVSSVKMYFVRANAAELPTAQSRKIYTSSFKKTKVLR